MIPNKNELQKFDQLQADLNVFLSPIKTLVVNDQDSCEKGGEAFRSIRKWQKKVDEKVKELIDPYNEEIAKIREYGKKIKQPLLDADTAVDKQLSAYAVHLAAKRAEMLKQEAIERQKREDEAAQLARQAKEEADNAALFADTPEEAEAVQAQANATVERVTFEAAKEHRTIVKSIASEKVRGQTTRWTFDIEDASKIPIEFKIVSEALIRAQVSVGVRSIPGVRIYQKTTMSAR